MLNRIEDLQAEIATLREENQRLRNGRPRTVLVNALALVPKGVQAMVAAPIRTVFAVGWAKTVRAQWREVVTGFRERFPRAAALMAAAEGDVRAYLAVPREHGRPGARWALEHQIRWNG